MQMSAFPVSMATNLKKMLETTTSNEQYQGVQGIYCLKLERAGDSVNG